MEKTKKQLEEAKLQEQLSNEDFKPIEFEGFLNQAGANAFTLSPMKWITSTNAIGIIVKKVEVAVHMHIKILPSNLHHGYLLNLNCISLKTISD